MRVNFLQRFSKFCFYEFDGIDGDSRNNGVVVKAVVVVVVVVVVLVVVVVVVAVTRKGACEPLC